MKRVESDQAVVLFGELMMRLSTKRHERIVQAREFDVSYSGAQAPDAIGDACLAYPRKFPVDLRHVTRCGSRPGPMGNREFRSRHAPWL